jgi:putative endopeptidase
MPNAKKLTLASLVVVASACGTDAAVEKKSEPAPAPVAVVENDTTREKGAAKVATKPSGLDLSRFDKTARPQDAFYRYVNGTWLDTFEMPADKSNYGAFTKLADDAEAQIRAIVEDSAKNTAGDANATKIGAAFTSFMDEAAIEALGAKPLDAERAQLAAIKTHDDVVRAFGRLLTKGSVRMPLGVYVSPDRKNPTMPILYVAQSGLGLPDRDYYPKTDTKFTAQRAAYVTHATTLFTLLGDKNAAKTAAKVFALEEKLADKQWTRADSRDIDKTTNKMTAAELAKLTSLKLPLFFEGLGVSSEGSASVVVMQPTYVKALGELLKATPVADWKAYLELRLVDAYAPYLSKAFVDANFAFYDKTLSGQSEPRPRWKRGISFVESTLGEAIGALYVAKHFKPEAKARMAVLVENLKKAFAASIDGLEWMSAETKVAAHEKIKKFNAKIGYPDVWRDYSALEMKSDDLVGNALRAARFETDRQLQKLGKPVDKTEWFMTPQTVNAYYSSTLNEIVFPAAILQPPFFNLEADDAVNYGSIGGVIGHELGHGFDDQGRKSDGDGLLRDWWTSDDKEKFKARADMLVAQYDEYVAIEDQKVNGRLTLGENIGDLGGLTVAYKAYLLSLDGGEAPVLDGFTGQQRFFLGWSQIWGRKYRDEELKKRLVTDPHAPSAMRVDGVVANMPEFYEAFGVKEGDKLHRAPEQRVKIW